MSIPMNIDAGSQTESPGIQVWRSRHGKPSRTGPGFAQWDEPRLVLDSTQDIEVNVATIVSRLR